jgi:polysaccharide export outer membrane protein
MFRINRKPAALFRRVTLAGAALITSLAIFHLGVAFAQAQSTASPEVAAKSPPNQAPANQNPDYKLGSGDRVRITIFNQPDLTGEYSVDGSGMLAFPLVGQVHAGGLTANQLEQALVKKLDPEYLRNPSVSVEVLTYRPFYIVGEVRLPGSYAYVSGMTVMNAVALAGGFTYRAREDSFYLTRKEGSKKVQISASPDTPVEPGDLITVRERWF